jgi:hypothetical protein
MLCKDMYLLHYKRWSNQGFLPQALLQHAGPLKMTFAVLLQRLQYPGDG